MLREPMLITAALFFIIVVGLCLLLIIRRVIMGRYLVWRLAKMEEWGDILNRIVARLDGPRPAEIESLGIAGRFSREILTEVLLSRMDLLVGNSRIPLTHVFEKTGLLNLSLVELTDKNVWYRRRAADHLGRGAGRDVAPHLVEALADPDFEVQVIASRSLGKLGIQTAAPYMVSLFAKSPDDICTSVADALIDLGQSTLEPLADAMHDDQPERSRYYAALTVSRICEEGRCRIEIIEAMPRRRATDVPARYPHVINERLLTLLGDGSARVRRAACEALASLQDFDSAPIMRGMALDDPAPEVRAAAAAALGIIRDRESAAALLKALDDPDWSVEYAASRALAALVEHGFSFTEPPAEDGSRAGLWLTEIRELAAAEEAS